MWLKLSLCSWTYEPCSIRSCRRKGRADHRGGRSVVCSLCNCARTKLQKVGSSMKRLDLWPSCGGVTGISKPPPWRPTSFLAHLGVCRWCNDLVKLGEGLSTADPEGLPWSLMEVTTNGEQQLASTRLCTSLAQDPHLWYHGKQFPQVYACYEAFRNDGVQQWFPHFVSFYTRRPDKDGEIFCGRADISFRVTCYYHITQ